MRIDGKTQLVGVIGWPVEHSLSPAMHNAAFEARGLNWCYVPLPVAPGQEEAAIRGLAALGFRGVNITVPHKQSVLRVLDTIAPEAAAIGAVNTILITREPDGRPLLHGYNTDAQGFVGALRREGFEPRGKQVVVVGAGGAARAVVRGLLEAGAGRITVLNRTLERARRLTSELQDSRLEARELTPELLVRVASEAELLVNTTTVGMWPHVQASIWPVAVPVPSHLTVFDLVYNPLETLLLRQAQECGARTIDGLGMLVEQGALAFEIWTGQPAPTAVMRAACEQWLHRA
ncbi:MAG: shikimate dehydrogenase [Anaerolineae bacterium]|nr:shikimate dehydrogenase [Anaerolineae bacterium]